MKLIFGKDEAIAKWVARRIPYAMQFDPCTAIGVVDEDKKKPIAGVVYHNYDPQHDTIMLSMAADDPRWAMRGTILALLHYPFEQLNVRKAWVACAFSNRRMIRFLEGINFTREAVLARHFGKEHAVILRMFDHDYRKLKERFGHGEKFTARANAA